MSNVNVAVDDGENIEMNPHSFHNVFKQVVACSRQLDLLATDIFAMLPNSQFLWYSQTQFCRSYKAASEGEVLEGIMSPRLADSIIEVTQTLSRRVMKTEKKLKVRADVSSADENLPKAPSAEINVEEPIDPSVKPNYLGYADFKKLVDALEKDKQVSLKSILPNLTKQFRLDVRRFLSVEDRAAKRAKFAISFEVISHISGIYDALPSISGSVANKGRDYLPDDVMDIREMTSSLTGMFNASGIDVKYDLKGIYDCMPAEYQKVVGLYEIKGWFQRGVTLARRDIASIFESAAIAKVNDLSGDKNAVIGQTELLNYPPELRPVR